MALSIRARAAARRGCSGALADGCAAATRTIHLGVVSEPAPIQPHLISAAAPAPPGSAALWRLPAIEALALGGFAAAVFFFHLGSYGLWEPDEARYAEIAREMLASRNFIVPHLNYVPYIEKPPMLYWLTTLAMSLLGVNEVAARFVNAFAALIGVAATCFFAAKTFDSRRAIAAGAVLSTSAIYAVMAQ